MKRMRAAATVTIRINAAMLVLVCCNVGGPSAWAIDCQSAAGDPKTGWYSWRLIDGRKCWFLKTGAMPAKSQLRWPDKAEEIAPEKAAGAGPAVDTRPAALPTAADESTEPLAATPLPSEAQDRPQPRPLSQLRFRTTRVKPAPAPLLHLGHGLDLMSGSSLTARTPPSLAPADPFHSRFTGGRD